MCPSQPSSEVPCADQIPSKIIPTPPAIQTYHCICSTLLLASPYLLSSLPSRAPPAKDRARILPLPPFRDAGFHGLDLGAGDDGGEKEGEKPPMLENVGEASRSEDDSAEATEAVRRYLPSLLLPTMRPARKITMVQREDGFERRRVWRCGRCGVTVGYEVENAPSSKGEAEVRIGRMPQVERTGMRVIFLLEGGLVKTGEMVDDRIGREIG